MLSSLQVTGENAFSYSYNGRNQLSSVTNPNSVQVSFTGACPERKRGDDADRRTRITDPGSYVEFLYNARDWITDVRNRTTGGTTRYDASYSYNDSTLWDNVGNPLKRTENIAGSTYTTTLRYDAVYRETEETKRDSSNNVVYSLSYSYDACGNRLTRALGGTTNYYGYDDNNKLTRIGSTQGGSDLATFSYDNNGNMTEVYGALYGRKTLTYTDENYLASIAYAGTTDYYSYTLDGRRCRATLGGTTYRYLYDGQRVVEDLADSGSVQARYTTEDGTYNGVMLHLYRVTGALSRFPMYDSAGSVRGLLDASGTVTDLYELDTFGRSISTSGSTPNDYRFGGGWGYITDPSGMLQLGVRHYWPELGLFLQQDPPRNSAASYLYADANPVTGLDPTGLLSFRVCWDRYWSVDTTGPTTWGPWVYSITCQLQMGVNWVSRQFYRWGWAQHISRLYKDHCCISYCGHWSYGCTTTLVSTTYSCVYDTDFDLVTVNLGWWIGFGGGCWHEHPTPVHP